jgi:hypothetical protein
VQQGQARTLPARLLEYFTEQALGLAQRAMPAGRGRGIDDYQPEFGRIGAAWAQQQILPAAWASFKQARRPVDTARRTTATGTVTTTA